MDTLSAPDVVKGRAALQALLSQLAARRRIPVNTYRMQLHLHFGFSDAQKTLGYLRDLGITDCYTSPILKANPGSMHGYDICDHNKINPELGTVEDYERWCQELRTQKLGHLLDFVPNHMGIDPVANPWWRDVLENGVSSIFAEFFDIDWDPVKSELKGKVLLPILGDHYGAVLDRGELQVAFREGFISLNYFNQNMPINAKQWPQMLRVNLERLGQQLGPKASAFLEFQSIMTQLDNLPPVTVSDQSRVAERRREKKIAQERLKRLSDENEVVRRHIEAAIKEVNGTPGDPSSFDLLHTVLEAQAYRLSYWKAASHEINYRRFFNINGLAGVRMEHEEVFTATHRLVLQLLCDGKVTGLRLDHVDGLYDPAVYFERLQEAFLMEAVAGQCDLDTLREWRTQERKKDPTGLAARPLFISVEKILSPGEVLDPHWSIDGTSGYDFLSDVNGLFVQQNARETLLKMYTAFTGERTPFHEIVYECKKIIMSSSMAGELNVLTHAMNRLSEADRHSRDYTLESLRDALLEVVACFPVYRTYINASRCGATDREIVTQAVAAATRRNATIEPSIFQFIREVLIPENVEKVPLEEFRRQLEFAMKFQQYTGPVQAKGCEDTAFYRYNPLLSINEVGSDPAEFGTTPEQFHERNARRHKDWPYTMATTSTHDTKWGEDARARLNVLSERADDWYKEVCRWAEINSAHRTQVDHSWAPDRNDEYRFYQTLIAIWPADPKTLDRDDVARRVKAYMSKAAKEAQRKTAWTNPNLDYENALDRFVQKVFDSDPRGAFWNAFEVFVETIAKAAVVTSLSQLVLKLASPAVVDVYQGSELWDLTLVDPDNRRPVDYVLRQKMLDAMTSKWVNVNREATDRSATTTWVGERLNAWQDGAIKLWVTMSGLRLRQQFSELFLNGSYMPLHASGALSGHVMSFSRSHAVGHLIVVVPTTAHFRDFAKGETVIPLPLALQRPSWINVLTGETVKTSEKNGAVGFPVDTLLKTLPVAMLWTPA